MPRSIITLLVLLVGAGTALGAAETYKVTIFTDGTNVAGCPALPSTGMCSLRAAILKSNSHAGTDTIQIPAGTYNLTITGRSEDAGATGDLDILDAVNITGIGTTANSVIIDCNKNDRAFDIQPGKNTNMSKLTIQNCDAQNDYGGAIFNSATTTLTDVVIQNNHAGASGGGISSEDVLTLTNVSLLNNVADTAGGGLDTTFTANLNNVTITGNTASTGGGINDDEEVNLTNVTVSGNTATTGGGLKNTVIATLTASTFANNGADVGGDYYQLGDPSVTDANFKYTILANATSGGACMLAFGTITSSGHNMETGNTCGFTGPGDLVNVVNAGLAPLASYTVLTGQHSMLMHALFQSSPALDAGGADCPPPAADQRALSRPRDGNGDTISRCDIGAFESDGTFPTTTTTSTTSSTTTSTTSSTTTSTTTSTIPTTTTSTTTTITTTTSTTTTVTTTSSTTTIVTTTTTSSTTSTTLACGDVNGDHFINVGDALVIAQYDVGARTCFVSPFAHPELCDVNRDGQCNVGDALAIARCDVGLISCSFNCLPFTCP